MNDNQPDMTFIIPFFNEEKHLGRTIASLLAQEMGEYRAEILLVDGRSTDGSRKVAESHGSSDRINLRVLDNPRRFASAGLNIGIAQAGADIIGFGGAHAVYPPDYIRTAVRLIKEEGQDVVGGWCSFRTLGKGVWDEAMTLLYKSPLGAGARREYRQKDQAYVNTVFGGVFRRTVFEKCGTYDESMDRGQDIDFNTRVRESGFRILYDPALDVEYYVKTEPRAFFSRAYRTSSSIASIFGKRGSKPGLHYFVPAGFLLYLVALCAAGTIGFYPLAVSVPAMLYLVLLLLSAFRLSRIATMRAALATVPVFFLYHVIYGLGLILGYARYFAAKAGATAKDRVR